MSQVQPEMLGPSDGRRSDHQKPEEGLIRIPKNTWKDGNTTVVTLGATQEFQDRPFHCSARNIGVLAGTGIMDPGDATGRQTLARCRSADLHVSYM